MGKKKKSGHKDISRTEKIVFATAGLELIEVLIEVIKAFIEEREGGESPSPLE